MPTRVKESALAVHTRDENPYPYLVRAPQSSLLLYPDMKFQLSSILHGDPFPRLRKLTTAITSIYFTVLCRDHPIRAEMVMAADASMMRANVWMEVLVLHAVFAPLENFCIAALR